MRRAPSAATRGLLRSYGPLGAIALAFLLMAAVVPIADRERETYAGNVSVPTPGGDTTGGDDGGTTTGGTGGDGGPGGTDGGTTGGSGGTGGTGGGGGGGVQPCTDRTLQVPGDPYSPPCYAFSGSNGGATHQGVTKDEIIITARTLEGPTAAEIFADISGQSVNDSPEAYIDTAHALTEYFSSRFQLYGRKIKLVIFRGDGSGASELLGGGKEKALSDAVRASKEHKAFADITGITIPYADALARQKVVNIGSPYPSREWFVNRRPYSWSLFPDGTNVVEAGAAAFTARFPPGSKVQFAGSDALNGKTRSFGVLAPENQEYQESVRAFVAKAKAAGLPIDLVMRYKLDISSMPNQASNIIAQMKDKGVTSVICACDPVMLALGMTPKANEQGYQPEWLTSGLGLRRPGHRVAAHRQEAVVARLRHRLQRRVGAAGPLVPLCRLQADAAQRRAGLRGGGDLLPDVPAGHRAPDGRSQPQPPDLRGRHVRLPGRSGAARPVGLRPGRLHAHRRLPGDLVGPRSHLRAEQPSRRVGAAQRRRPLVGHPPTGRPGRLLQGGLTISDNGSEPTVDRDEALASLRTTPDNVHLLRGYGPLVVGVLLFVLMVTLAPTVAPERVVERPVDAPAAEDAP